MSRAQRKPIAGLIMIAVLTAWIVAAATIGTRLTGAPGWLQLGFYVLAGVAWVLPLRPVFRWMNSAPE